MITDDADRAPGVLAAHFRGVINALLSGTWTHAKDNLFPQGVFKITKDTVTESRHFDVNIEPVFLGLICALHLTLF